MKKLKVGILTIICALAMVMPVMAASYQESYSGPIGTHIRGTLTTTTDYSGGRPIAKHLKILTATDKTVQTMVMKYEIQGKDGKRADVHENYGEFEFGNINRYEFNWHSNSNEIGVSYTVFATHEMKHNGYSHAVYTSTGL